MRYLPRILAVVALVAGSAAPVRAEWRRIETPSFIIIGDVSAATLRNVAVQFEGFRETMTRVLGERATRIPVPTVVVVFPHDRAFTPFKPKFQGRTVSLGGLFQGRPDANYIALVDDGNPQRLPVVFHEYVHLLVSNSGLRVPAWLGEGLAEFYSTYQLARGGREAVIGGYIAEHLALLNKQPLLTFDQLLAVDRQSPLYNEGSRRSLFYAQSWALTHMLMLNTPDRSGQLTAYAAAVTSGLSSVDAWRQVFGAEDVFRELSQYIRRQAFREYVFTFSARVVKFEAPVAGMTEASAAFFLADLLRRQGRFDEAAARLATVGQSTEAAIMSALIDADRKDWASAVTRLRAAGRPADWVAAYIAGVALTGAIRGGQTPASDPDLQLAHSLLGRNDGVVDVPNATAQRAVLELRSRDGPSAQTVEALRQARAASPGRHDYGLLLAEALARRREFQAVREVLGPMMSPAMPENIRESARRLMGSVVDFEAALARPAGAAGAAGATPPGTGSSITGSAAGSPTGRTTADDDAVIRPDFRQTQPGEERIEGILESIGCQPRTGISFAVRIDKELVSFTAPDLGKVDFITYRDDLRGSVTCGPLKPAMAVYVTFRPGTDRASRGVAVAIEFLPKPR